MKEHESNIVKYYKENVEKYKYFSFKITNDLDSSEDIVQELFIYLIQNQNNDDFNFNSRYIYEKLKYKSIDYLRDKQASPVILDNLEELVLDNEMENLLEESYLFGTIIDDINSLLNKFSQKQIDVFRLFYYEGYKLKEISETLEISRYHVTKILKQFNRKFKKN